KLRSLKSLAVEVYSPAQQLALAKALPRCAMDVELADDPASFLSFGDVKVGKPATRGAPWVIFQDLVDDLCLDDQNDVEEQLSDAFAAASPKLHAKITFDSEGSAFVASSKDKAAIVALARLIQQQIRAAG
ncbi:MAG: hypothetical protein NT062_26655, partial [Proteobacteria bacterium]|nr:hypothetical protein [Pseudomonadota bacterium]